MKSLENGDVFLTRAWLKSHAVFVFSYTVRLFTHDLRTVRIAGSRLLISRTVPPVGRLDDRKIETACPEASKDDHPLDVVEDPKPILIRVDR